MYGPPEYNTQDDGQPEVWNIVDANGNRVIETDSGFYPPKSEDAELIVDAVNGIPHCEHCQALVSDAKIGIERLRKIFPLGPSSQRHKDGDSPW